MCCFVMPIQLTIQLKLCKYDIVTILSPPIQWPCGLRRGPWSLIHWSRVRIPIRAWMFVLVFLCFVVLCRQRPCDGLITRPRSPTICRNRLGRQKIRGGKGPYLDCRANWRRRRTILSQCTVIQYYKNVCPTKHIGGPQTANPWTIWFHSESHSSYSEQSAVTFCGMRYNSHNTNIHIVMSSSLQRAVPHLVVGKRCVFFEAGTAFWNNT
jgi:hypothetical protein